jgi:protein-tyrosine phosphatase
LVDITYDPAVFGGLAQLDKTVIPTRGILNLAANGSVGQTRIRSVANTGNMAVKTILFLCTGNYYRSRFAEELFNHRAGSGGLSWTAQSRALAVERLANEIGPISRTALKGLQDRGCTIRGAHRSPRQCTMSDLKNADHIVAIDKFEHRLLLRERFPSWEQRVEYWDIGDIGVMPPDVALAELESRIEALILRMPRN